MQERESHVLVLFVQSLVETARKKKKTPFACRVLQKLAYSSRLPLLGIFFVSYC